MLPVVMIVEDEFHAQAVLSHMLHHLGVRVVAVNDGAACLKALESHHPHLIIMDLAMPEKDGWQTLAAIRANPAIAHLPVVAVTAYHSVETQEDARRAGFDAFFGKPFKRDELVALLAHFLPPTY